MRGLAHIGALDVLERERIPVNPQRAFAASARDGRAVYFRSTGCRDAFARAAKGGRGSELRSRG